MNKSLSILIALILMNLWFCSSAFPIDVDAGIRFSKPVRNFKEMKSKNVISQTHDFSCGPASLATLFSYYFQDKVTEAQIIKYLLLTTDIYRVKERKGFSLLDLKNFAKARGYEVVGYRMDIEYLVDLDKPVLVPINIKDYSHFVIVRGVQGDRVFIADPALGNMTMRIEKFLGLWRDGIGMLVSKTDKKVDEGPLALSEQERAVFADPSVTRRIFDADIIGQIYAEGEFK